MERNADQERYLFEADGPPDAEVRRLERLLARYRYEAAALDLPEDRERRGGRAFRALFAIAAGLLLALLLVQHLLPRGERHGYAVRGVAGVDRLEHGGWLETGEGEWAEIEVGEIGQVELEPGGRVRLDDDGERSHSLYLDRGALNAMILAEPRMFQVGTPGGLTVDLGCVYRVEVDERRVTHLSVSYGKVSFETEGRKVFCPEGARCTSLPGRGPSAPLFERAEPAFAAAVEAAEFAPRPEPADLETIRSSNETLTLWHLLVGASREVREAAYDALARAVPPPDGVTRAGILAGDEEMRERWRHEMDWDWTPW